jgi:hypothetical protein
LRTQLTLNVHRSRIELSHQLIRELSTMDVYYFTAEGREFTAENANWAKNGEQVWDIFDADENMVDSITVHPFSDISAEATLWAEVELSYAA